MAWDVLSRDVLSYIQKENQKLANVMQKPLDFYVCGIDTRKVLSFHQIYFSCNKGVPELVYHKIRIYTTNVGIHRL